MPNILQIAAHMGGGVGKAISELALRQQQLGVTKHQIVLLEDPINCTYVDQCRASGVEVARLHSLEQLGSRLKEADIVLFNWWHHPQMCNLLAKLPDIPIRSVLWCHVNGCTYPDLPFSLVDCVDLALFTTPFSMENSAWTQTQLNRLRLKSSVVYGMGRLHTFEQRRDCTLHTPITIGYVGTLDYTKIHPQFVSYSAAAAKAIPGVKFLLIGAESPELKRDFQKAGLLGQTEWTGHISDVDGALAQCDILGYLLNPFHFGSTDNALLEALSAGVPTVALSKSPESFVFEDQRTGFLVSSPAEYAEVVQALVGDLPLRERISHAAQDMFQGKFDYKKNQIHFLNLMERLMTLPKRPQDFAQALGPTPADWFLCCAGKYEPLFRMAMEETLSDEAAVFQSLQKSEPIFRAESKSSVYHFARLFPEDERLHRLADRMRCASKFTH